MKKFIFLLFSFLLIIIATITWFVNGLIPLNQNKMLKRFEITPGETASQIGLDLEKQGFIKNALSFRIYSQVSQSSKNIKPGSYELTSNLWIPQIINKLLAGPQEIWVTIPEGLRREEVVDKFTESFGLEGTLAVNFKNQFLKLTQVKEGYLFPDTYLFPKDITPQTVVKIMEDNFNKKYVSVQNSKTSNLNKEQTIILASIIQREAITPEDMKGVASVLVNRYNLNSPLGSDVTVEYALGFDKNENSWWKKDLTADDLQINSSYNTRQNVGFPPAPISNPGLVAIKAALNPPQTDYIYYLSDKDGKLHFAKTLEEHNINIEKYL